MFEPSKLRPVPKANVMNFSITSEAFHSRSTTYTILVTAYFITLLISQLLQIIKYFIGYHNDGNKFLTVQIKYCFCNRLIPTTNRIIKNRKVFYQF